MTPFSPHPNLSQQINHNIIESEFLGGVDFGHLPSGTRLQVTTRNRAYTLESCGDRWARISGHPQFCPEPVLVRIVGSNWGGSMLKMDFIGRGMHLEFRHPDHDRPIITSRILDVAEIGHA